MIECVGQLRCQIRFFVRSGFQSMRAKAVDLGRLNLNER